MVFLISLNTISKRRNKVADEKKNKFLYAVKALLAIYAISGIIFFVLLEIAYILSPETGADNLFSHIEIVAVSILAIVVPFVLFKLK